MIPPESPKKDFVENLPRTFPLPREKIPGRCPTKRSAVTGSVFNDEWRANINLYLEDDVRIYTRKMENKENGFGLLLPS